MDYKRAKSSILSDSRVRKEFEKPDLNWEIAKSVIKARLDKGMSQAQLARRIGTKQPSIARIESGNHTPSIGILQKIAHALGTELIPPTFKSLIREAKFVHENSSNAFVYFPTTFRGSGTVIASCLDFLFSNTSGEEAKMNIMEA